MEENKEVKKSKKLEEPKVITSTSGDPEVESAAEAIKNGEKRKLTYEELENVAKQLSEQAQKLYQQLQQSNMINTFKRLDYLFKVIEYGHQFTPAFVEKCKDEVVMIMTVPDAEEPQYVADEEKKEAEENK